MVTPEENIISGLLEMRVQALNAYEILKEDRSPKAVYESLQVLKDFNELGRYWRFRSSINVLPEELEDVKIIKKDVSYSLSLVQMMIAQMESFAKSHDKKIFQENFYPNLEKMHQELTLIIEKNEEDLLVISRLPWHPDNLDRWEIRSRKDFPRVFSKFCRREGYYNRFTKEERDSYLKRMNLTRSYLDGASLNDVDLSGIDFTESSFRNTCLEGADLRFTVFDEADLEDASLYDADIAGAEFFRTRNIDRSRLKEARNFIKEQGRNLVGRRPRTCWGRIFGNKQ